MKKEDHMKKEEILEFSSLSYKTEEKKMEEEEEVPFLFVHLWTHHDTSLPGKLNKRESMVNHATSTFYLMRSASVP
jgi:hypothetical protein